MKRFSRIAALPAALAAVLVLAVLPLGTREPNRSGSLPRIIGPDVALARILFSRAISIPFGSLFGITEPAVLLQRGQGIEVSGRLACEEGGTVRVRATVAQQHEDTSDQRAGALAEGTTVDVCSGDMQTWFVQAAIRAGTNFELGRRVRVCAVATTWGRGHVITDTLAAGLNDAWQWCDDLLLR